MKKLLCILGLFITLHAVAQDDPGDGDAAVPVDGGVTLLLAAGAAYGAKRVRQKPKG